MMTVKQNHIKIFICIFLVTATLVLYWQIRDYQFVNYDDDLYVTNNAHVRNGLNMANICWALKATDAGFWHPMTWLSLMADHQFYGLYAGGYHWTNLLLHIGSILLLFLALQRMTGVLWQSGFVAALFAIHPLHVESVAWIAERKDVLCGFFWIFTMWFYVLYVERPGWFRYTLVVLAFILGLMSKPMIVTLPFVLLLLDYWPLGRFVDRARPATSAIIKSRPTGFLIVEKLPLIMLAGVTGVITYFAEHKIGALPSLESFPWGARIDNALISYVIYIWKTFWPTGLAVFYPHPGIWPLWQVSLAGFFLLIVCLAALWAIRSRPYAVVGWLWYLGTLIPMIGLIQIGGHAMADRYTYIPLIGIFIILTWGVSALVRGLQYRPVILGGATVVSLVLVAFLTWHQVQYWKDSLTLFRHAVDVTVNNYRAHQQLGLFFMKRGEYDQAINHLSTTLQIKPDSRSAHNIIGVVLANQGHVGEAKAHFIKVLQIKPDDPIAHNNLGVLLDSLGQKIEARRHFSEALRIKPDYTDARINLESTDGLVNEGEKTRK